MTDFLALAQPGVQQLSPYVPGKPVDELARELDLDPASIVKLASNENPLGPSAKVLEAIRNELAELTRYPDGNGFELKSRLAQRCAVQINQVTLGNGSNDILDLVARAYLAPGLNAVFSQYAFAVYPIATQAVGAEGRVVPAKDHGHDLEAMLAAIDGNTRVVFIANPNNPTGTWFGPDALEPRWGYRRISTDRSPSARAALATALYGRRRVRLAPQAQPDARDQPDAPR